MNLTTLNNDDDDDNKQGRAGMTLYTVLTEYVGKGENLMGRYHCDHMVASVTDDTWYMVYGTCGVWYVVLWYWHDHKLIVCYQEI